MSVGCIHNPEIACIVCATAFNAQHAPIIHPLSPAPTPEVPAVAEGPSASYDITLEIPAELEPILRLELKERRRPYLAGGPQDKIAEFVSARPVIMERNACTSPFPIAGVRCLNPTPAVWVYFTYKCMSCRRGFLITSEPVNRALKRLRHSCTGDREPEWEGL